MNLNNRRGRFDKPHISACVERLAVFMDERSKKKGAVIKLYLSNFTSYNDSFGYAFGGALINEITAFLESVEGIEVYHIRGVEYIMIAETPSRKTVKEILDTIMQRFENVWRVNDIVCTCSVNAGVVYFPGYASTPDEILEQLGRTINESAQSGHNQLVEYDEKLIKQYYRRNRIAQQIPQAIESGDVDVRFQSTYQVSAKRFTRIECKLSMFCEGFGEIGEDELVSIAEQSGQIYAISQFAISRACDLIAELVTKNKDFETVSVKVSPIQLLQERFTGDVAEIIKESGIQANRLAFEVDERAAYSVFACAHMCMSELSDMGIEMILSDFGTGSLGVFNILSMLIDVVKIKKILIWQMDNTPNGASLVDALIHLAKNSGLKLVAEGVETEAQMKMLGEFGCEYQQGSYYSNLLTSEELIASLQSLK